MKSQFELNPPHAFFTPRSSTVLAFDFGLKRIGVATGDLSLKIAHPLETIPAKDCFECIARIVKEWQPALFIVGLPYSEDGEERDITRASRRFARELEARFGVIVTLVDERFTSRAASAALKEAGIAGIRQKALLDQVAAQQILQSFFDSHASS
ncbi:MAG: Holliday junction resolvase RuvX [Burkholderiales bacterium]